jgi:hypothetical protein
MKKDCSGDKLFDLIIKRLDSLEQKIDNLLQFKWKIMGFITGITILSTLVANFLI